MQKTRFLLPNLFTGLNFLIAVYAILWSASAFATAESSAIKAIIMGSNLVILCVLLDKLDGFAARIMNASSEFGAQFDSLADLVAFGLAPAIGLFFAYKNLVPDWFAAHTTLLIISISLYVVCAATRLAKYNAVDSDAFPDYFMGMPSTFAGGLNAVLLLLFVKYGLFEEGNRFLHMPAAIMALSAVLMVSPLFLPKLKSRKSKFINAMQLINIVITYLCGFFLVFSEMPLFYAEYLFAQILLYASVGFGYGILKRDEILEEEALKSKARQAQSA